MGDIADELRRVEDNVTQDSRVSRRRDEQRVVSEKLYIRLALLGTDEAASQVRSAGDGTGDRTASVAGGVECKKI